MPELEVNPVPIAPTTATACPPARLAKIVTATQATTEPMVKSALHVKKAATNPCLVTILVCLVPVANIPTPLQRHQAPHVSHAPRPTTPIFGAPIVHRVLLTAIRGRVDAIKLTASAIAVIEARMADPAKLARTARSRCAPIQFSLEPECVACSA